MVLTDFFNLNLFAFMLVFVRLGAALSIMPGFGALQVPMPIRLTFALLFTLMVTPLVMDVMPAEPTAVSALFLLIASETVIGLFMGIIPRVMMGALQTAGTMLAMVSSMANMFVQDPISEQQSSLFATFLGLLALTLVFVTDTHHLMLAALVDSYSLFTPVTGPMIGDMSDYMARTLADSFAMGVQLISPMIVAGISYYLGLGILGRLMPQLPVFFFGMPVQILMQLSLIMITIPAMMLVFMTFFEDGLVSLTRPAGL